MDEVKGLLASKGVWGGVIAFLGALAAIFHIDFGAADQAATLDAVWQIVSAAGALLAIWGRITAKKRIG